MDSEYMSCVLKFDAQYSGWHMTLTKLLKKIKGVYYSIDAEQGIVHISGKVDPIKFLEMVAKSSKYAELCWMESSYNNKDNTITNYCNSSCSSPLHPLHINYPRMSPLMTHRNRLFTPLNSPMMTYWDGYGYNTSGTPQTISSPNYNYNYPQSPSYPYPYQYSSAYSYYEPPPQYYYAPPSAPMLPPPVDENQYCAIM